MAHYVEVECENGHRWEVYCKAVVYGPEDYDLVPVPDGPEGYRGSFECEVCGHEGEQF